MVAFISGVLMALIQLNLVVIPARNISPLDTKGDEFFTEPASIGVSVIILTYKKFEALSRLLPSVIRQKHPHFEIIIADNGCLPETKTVIDRAFAHRKPSSGRKLGHLAHHLKICNNPGYSAGNNAAVKLASPTSKYLLFLNDDIVLTRPTFMQNLVELVDRHHDAVAAGCKMVDATGEVLVEAGSMVFQDATAAGYGRGDRNPYKGEYSYPRPVDYVSGACLLVEKNVFQGYVHSDGGFGFDGSTFPNYYEDTDLQLYFQHELKKEVWFQPKSVARHEEHGSFGKDESKSLMEKAQQNFQEKWKEELNANHLDVKAVNDRGKLLIQGADLRSRNPSVANILYIDDRPPNKSKGSGYGRAFDNLSMITELGHRVTLTAIERLDGFCDGPCIDELTELGIEYASGSVSKMLESRAGYYDIVIVSRPQTLKHFLMLLQEFYSSHPFILVYDCEALTFRRTELMKNLVDVERIQFPGKVNLLGISQQLTRSDEISLVDRADVVVAVSDNEKRVIAELTKDAKSVYSIGHIMKGNPLPNFFHDREGILFVGAFHGSMFYNGDAIWYFLTEIYPLVIKESGLIPLTIVGRGIPKKLRLVAEENETISKFVTFVESPPSILHYFGNCRIFIAPHLYGAGIQYKVSEALSVGTPVVMSGLTYGSFGHVPGCVGSDVNEFKQCIIDIHSNEKKWKALRQAGLDFIVETHSRQKVIKIWSSIISSSLKAAKARGQLFQKGKLPPAPLTTISPLSSIH